MIARQERLLTDEIGRGIMRVRRLMVTEAAKRLEEQQQSVLAWQALNYLDQWGPAAQATLAEALGQHATGISRLVGDLAWERLVSRKKAANDRRYVLVKLTRKGKSRLEAGRPLVESAVEEILAPLDDDDRRALRNLLWRMIPQK
ncbi:MAG: MarR family winged helix-turn-helix transcriptional regulator [Myxococcales bacterium]